MKVKAQNEAHFEINELLSIGMVLVVLGIGIAYGLEVMSDVRDDMGVSGCADRTDGYTTYNLSSAQCTNSTDQLPVGSAEFNSSSSAITGVGKIPEKMPTIATIVVASVIIGILVTYMWARFAK